MSAFVAVHTIPSSLVLNWDQTGINVVPSADYTVEQRGSKRIEIAGYQDKRQITATFAATLSGKFLPIQFCMLERQIGVTLSISFQLVLMSIIPLITGQMRKQ